MSDTMQNEFTEMVEQMNSAVAESIEQNMEAQAAFMESWSDAFEDSIPDEDVVAEGMEGYANAYEVWIDAVDETFTEATNLAEGEDIKPEQFRDIWLSSANQAFKEVMSTSAFAQANGQLVESIMEMQQEINEMSEDSLAQMGMPTQSDVEEVGERLIELERRQHAVESKLDQILDALEE